MRSRCRWKHVTSVLRASLFAGVTTGFSCPEDLDLSRMMLVIEPPECLPVTAGDSIALRAFIYTEGPFMPGPATPVFNAEWSVAPDSVATISDSGIFRALRPGIAHVRASLDGLRAPPRSISVMETTGPLVLEPSVLTVEQGASFELRASVNDLNGIPIAGLTPLLISANDTVLKREGGLRFTARYPGTANVVVCMASHTDTASVTVFSPSLPASGAARAP